MSKDNPLGKSFKDSATNVRCLYRKFGDFEATTGISFEVKWGEKFAILGPNSTGKTITLEIIETLTPKTSGQFLLYGLILQLINIKIRS